MASSNPQRILPLSAEAITQIHSSKHITSLQGVVLSLLENSLDAAATKINISVDWRKGSCTIEDNGSGIPSAEFGKNGGLGRMYCTSKRTPSEMAPAQPHELHGSDGMFLAELAATSLLSIDSNCKGSEESSSILMHLGKVLLRRAPDERILSNPDSSGTTVDVKDLFGNMPVRVKQRALSYGIHQLNDRAWQELNRGVVAYLQAWPMPCSVSIRDANAEARVVTISGSHHSTSYSLTTKNLQHLAGRKSVSRYDVRDALPMLFQSGLAPHESQHRWVPLSASSSNISLKGLLCLDPAPGKLCQFISIGITPCNPTSGNSELHETVNKVFDNSSFGAVEDRMERGRNETIAKSKIASPSREVQSRKGLDRFPMYCIQINMTSDKPNSPTDLDQMSEASLAAIIEVLAAAVHAWLEKNHFRPRKRTRRRKEQLEPPAMASAQSSRPSSAQAKTPDDDASSGDLERLKIHEAKRRRIVDLSTRPGSNGQAHCTLAPDYRTLSSIRMGRDRHQTRPQSVTSRISCDVDLDPPMTESDRKRVSREVADDDFGPRPNTTDTQIMVPTSDDFGSVDDAEMIAVAEGLEEDLRLCRDESPQQNRATEDGTFVWTDPWSNQVYRVNSRTGVVLPHNVSGSGPQHSAHGRQRAGIDTTLSSAGKPLRLAQRQALFRQTDSECTTPSNGKWLPGFLREWNNPVFAQQQEEPIRAVSVHGLDLDEHNKTCSHGFDHDSHLNSGTTKLSKSALQDAQVLGQVDRKFILCKLPQDLSQHNDTLVLADQHAASERVLLESLLSELGTPPNINSCHLETETSQAKALRFQISTREQDLFRTYCGHFVAWGFIYELDHQTLKVTHLPTLLAARCAALPSLCIDLLRAELWSLAEGEKRCFNIATTADGQGWISFISRMPTKMLEMLNSRACRSAVMFNDVLSLEECQEIMEKVARCVFPFVCAHGRVSMVPVMELKGNAGLESLTLNETLKTDAVDGLAGEATCSANSLSRWMREQ